MESTRSPARRVVIAGMDRAGKSTLARVLASDCAARIFEIGDFVRVQQLENSWLAHDTCTAYEQLMVTDIRAALLSQVLQIDNNACHPFNIICGVRDSTLIDEIDAASECTLWVWVEASRPIRLARPQREQKDIVQAEMTQRKWGIEKVKSRADFTLTNNHSMREFLHHAAVLKRELTVR